MWLLLLGMTSGLLAPTRSAPVQVKSRTCSFEGLFLVEGPHRYALTFAMASEVCEQLGSTLATYSQLSDGFNATMETCRIGWASNQTTAILRHSHHENCAKNTTGLNVYTPENPLELFDAYCYDRHAGPGENCSQVIVSDEVDEPGSEDGTKAGNRTFPDTLPDPQILPTEDEPDFTDEQSTSLPGVAVTDVEEPAGSGMMPPTSEEDFSPTAPVPTDGHHNGMDTALPGEVIPSTSPDFLPNQEVAGSLPGGGTVKDGEEAPKQHPPGNRMITVATPSSPSAQEDSSAKWMIIGIIVAIVAIVLICAAIAKRNSWCGKHQSLMISSKDNGSEGNGAPAVVASSRAQEREQEMVTLMNKEKIQENGKGEEEFTVITLEESSDKERQGA